ncbi:MAG: MauE/DoxX family redox-associated membrane protein [Phycisphaerae bacterium]
MSEYASMNVHPSQQLAPKAPRPAPFPVRALALYLPRILVAAMFLFTGTEKLKTPAEFAKEIRAYEMVPVDVAHWMAMMLPPLEVLTALLLLLGPLRKEARLILLGMLVVFTVAKSIVLAKGLDIHCGCVPSDSPLKFLFSGITGILTNCVMIALLVMEGLLSRRLSPGRRSYETN